MTGAGGRPPKWGTTTRWVSIRIPEPDYRHLDAMAKKAGVKVPDVHHAMLQELKLGGDPLQRQILLRAELEISRQAHHRTGRDAARVLEKLKQQVGDNMRLRAKLAGVMRLLRRATSPERIVQLLEGDAAGGEPSAPSPQPELVP